MSADGNNWLNGFDTRLTRRSLLLSLPAMAAARALLQAQSPAGTLKIRAFNHMTLSVADQKRSIDFYQELFGMPVHARTAVSRKPATTASAKPNTISCACHSMPECAAGAGSLPESISTHARP